MAVLLLLTLLAATAHAATAIYNFEGTHACCNDAPNMPNPIGTLTSSGISATFGNAFQYTTAPDTTGNYCYGGVYAWSDAGQQVIHGLTQGGHSGTGLARFSHDWCEFTTADRTIYFDPPIKFFSCWLSGTTKLNAWACPPYLLRFDDSASQGFNVHAISGAAVGPFGLDQSTPRIEMSTTAGISNIVGTTYPAQEEDWSGCGPEYADGVQNYSNTKSPMCTWQYVEVASQTPVHYIYFRMNGYAYGPLFIDDVRAATGTCPNPPCQFGGARVFHVAALDPEREVADHPGLQLLNAVTGERVTVPSRRAHRDGIMYVTPAQRLTFGQLKAAYR
jgi:hypothetical protein